MQTKSNTHPSVSVAIRSFHRPEALNELIARLRTQRYPDFEIVVYEQSDSPELVAQLEALNEPRLKVVVGPALSPPAARNAAIRGTRGEILLFIDDDDLPVGDDWIERHVENYADPRCMGVTGRLLRDPNRLDGPRFPRLIRSMAMRHTLFKDTVMLAHNTLRKEGIGFLIGSNASVRRSLLQRVGGWDEGVPMHEEQSFAFKFAQQRGEGEYFVFDPAALMWRRTGVPGGLGRRSGDDWHVRELEGRLFFYKHVVGHYFGARYRLLAPLFWLRGLEQVIVWIWDPDNGDRPFGARVRASLGVFAALPEALRFRRFPADRIRRVPSLELDAR
ncbi:MAG: glycosyltransferase [Polyangiaceae bacterium]